MLSFAVIIMTLLYFSAPSLAECKQESNSTSLLDKTMKPEYLQSLTSEIINVTCEGNYTTEIKTPRNMTCYSSEAEAYCTANCNYNGTGSPRDQATANMTANVACISEEIIKFHCTIHVQFPNDCRTEMIKILLESKTAPDSSSIVIAPSTAIITSSLPPTDHTLTPISTETSSDVIILSVTTSAVILGLMVVVITGAIATFVCIKRKKNNSLKSLNVPRHFRENPIYEKTSPLYDVVLDKKDLSLLRGITSSYDVIKKTFEGSDEHTTKIDDKVKEDVQYIEMSRVHIRSLENSGLCTSNVYY